MKVGASPRKGDQMRAAQRRFDGPSVSVAAVGGDDAFRRRLSSLAGRSVIAVDPEIIVAQGISSSLLADVEVAVVTLREQDAAALGALRSLRRWNPRLRLVVVGEDLALFEDAFEFGADVWIDPGADDATVRTAIRGH